MHTQPVPQFTTLILDLGDVLLDWTSHNASIPSSTIRRIITSTTWFAYERGTISQKDCFLRLASHLNLEFDDVQSAFEHAHLSITPKYDVIDLVRKLKAQGQGLLRILAMSNMPLPNYERLRPMFQSWNIFDDYYISCNVGERKPSLRFFSHVIEAASFDPSKAVFLDDKLDNVLAARSFGIHGIVFDEAGPALRRLSSAFSDDPSKRGWNFILSNAGKLESTSDAGEKICENFAQLIILEVTQDSTLVTIEAHGGTWNFFRNEDPKFPFDLDTTSLALTIIPPDVDSVHSTMEDMLKYLDEDGIVQTYFDNERPRTDPVVCTNVLFLFAKYGRENELEKTFEWIYHVLLHRAYIDGTRYYVTAECFLYFLSRLLSTPGLSSNKAALLRPLLRERIYERVGTGGDALALAMRILVCASVGLPTSSADRDALLRLQLDDGGWDEGWFYRNGSTGKKIGNRGVTTVLALKALGVTEGLADVGIFPSIKAAQPFFH